MRNLNWKRVMLAVASGAVLLQAPGCTETALYVSTLASSITAGGVLYLVTRVMD